MEPQVNSAGKQTPAHARAYYRAARDAVSKANATSSYGYCKYFIKETVLTAGEQPQLLVATKCSSVHKKIIKKFIVSKSQREIDYAGLSSVQNRG